MLINSPNISGSLNVTGNAAITGSLTVLGGINATIEGTAATASYIDYNNVDNKPTLISGSSQIAGLGYAITGSNQFDGSQAITGSLTVTGDIIAQTLNVQQVTSSVVYSSGSNIFGNELSNTHQFTGSLSVTGSLAVNGLSAITGTGTRTENFIPKFGSGGNTIQNSLIFDNGTSVGINNANPNAGYILDVNGDTIVTATVFQPLTLRRATNTIGFAVEMPFQLLNSSSNYATYSHIRSFIVDNTAGSESGGLRFSTSNAGIVSTQLEIDNRGNLGLGVTPSAWGNIFKALELNTTGAIASSGNDVQILTNAFFNGTSFIYKQNQGAARFRINEGQFIWQQAASGTAGQTISFTQAMTLTAGGNLLLGGTSDFTSLGNTSLNIDRNFNSGHNIRISNQANNSNASANLLFGTFGNSWVNGMGSNSSSLGNNLYWAVDTSTSPLQYRMVLTTGGNLGIGTDNPVHKLDVAGEINVSDGQAYRSNGQLMMLRNASTGEQRFGSGSLTDYVVLYAGATPRMTITSDGNVLIGATSNVATARRELVMRGGNGSVLSLGNDVTADRFQIVSDSGENALINNKANTPMILYTNNTERMRITSEGVSMFNSRVNVNGADDDADIAMVIKAPSGSGKWILFGRDSSNNAVFQVASNGDVTNTNNSYGSISDIKLKENIINASPKLEDLLKVKIRNYNLIGDNKKQIGVIAQELEEVFPSMVEESEDFKEIEITDEEGNITKERQSTGTTTKSVKYSVFVPMLIKAIQEQQTQIETLKAENKTLTMEIQSIKDSLK